MRLIIEKFPAFGALFQTLKVAAIDLLKFFCSIIVLMLGFTFTLCLILGPYDALFVDVWLVLSELIFSMLGESKNIKHDNLGWVATFTRMFYIIFLLIFYFILAKMLISMVIIRYLYLRTLVQLDNNARARILQKQAEAEKNKWINLVLFRRNSRDTSNQADSQVISPSWWQTFRLNLNEIMSKPKIKSKEFLQKEHDNAKREIIIEKMKKKKERNEKYSNKNFHIHKRNLYM